ncbi:MAG: ferrochelatase [Polyangiaceae bacterium]|nr:ferrochelatase [Polyangiaceae bacterium]
MTWKIIVIAHGSIAHLDEIPAFVREIRRGRPAPQELLDELKERYTAIGGSPLLEETESITARLGEACNTPAFTAMRLSAPRITSVAEKLTPGDRICLVPAAPFSVHIYAGAAQAALKEGGFEEFAETMASVPPFGTAPQLVKAWSGEIIKALEKTPEASVLLTAHSLPQMLIDRGDPYATFFENAVAAVTEELDSWAKTQGLTPPAVELAYQSQGAQAGAWLGPTLESKLQKVRDAGQREVIVSPIGFLSEHVETLYDLDIEAAAWAKEMGLHLTRIPTVGGSDLLIEAVAELVKTTMAE